MPKKEFTIGKNDAGQRLDKFITKTLPNLPQSMMYKAIRKKDIKLNGKRCEIDSRLKQDDAVSMFLKDEFFQTAPKEYDFVKAPKKLNIVYEDSSIMLLDKKPGLIVHPDQNYHFDSLIARVQHYLYDKGEYNPEEENSFAPALVNRIDRNTGGIVIVAKTAEALRVMNQKLKDREVDKFYLCLVQGILDKKEGLLTGYLEKNEDQNRVYISDKKTDQGKTIRTKYRVLEERGGNSLVEVELLTGRTHQIRAHFAHIGHPLLGDGKYGKNAVNRKVKMKYQALYSYKLVFNFTTSAGELEYLNHKEFSSDNAWFLDEFYQMGKNKLSC